jgi:regulatory protein
MTVVSVEVGADPEVFNVRLQDGSSFLYRSAYLDPPFTAGRVAEPGKELSADEEVALSRAAERLRAEHSALRLIALREHSRSELTMKLKKRGFVERDISLVMDRLEAEDLVNDGRFAALWVDSRLARRTEGPALLAARLRSHGVSRELAREAVSRAVDEEAEVRLVERFLGAEGDQAVRDGPALRARLRKAGFSASAVRAAFERRER